MQANSDNDVKSLIYKSLAVVLLLIAGAPAMVSAQGVLAGKHVVALGDSNTWIGGDSCDNTRGWNYWFARATSPASMRSYARSGATWSHTSKTVCDLEEYTEIITDNNVIYNQVMRLIDAVGRGEQRDPDVIMVAAGTNDAWFPQFRPEQFSRTSREALGRDEVELMASLPGKVLSLPEAVRYDLLMLQARFPSAAIIVLTPMQSVKISPRMLADVSGIIEEVAMGVGASVIRQDLLCPVNSEKESVCRQLTTDGTHTSTEGARRNASVIAKCVEGILAGSAPQTHDIVNE